MCQIGCSNTNCQYQNFGLCLEALVQQSRFVLLQIKILTKDSEFDSLVTKKMHMKCS